MSTTERLGEVKRQHYVPRMLLRNFSKDGTRISLVVDGKRIDGTSIKNQCQEDYFYGADNIMEKSFGNSEAKMAALLGDLAPGRFSDLTEDDVHELRLFLAYQHFRTRGAAEHISRFQGALAKAVLKSSAALNKDGELTADDLEDVDIGVENAQNQALWIGTKSLPILFDLAIKFIATERSPGFVVADHPVVAYNQFAEHHPILSRYPTGVGLAHKGLQLFMPLSPSMVLALYDPSTYEYGGKGFVCKAGPGDVAFLNRMQAVNAFSCVYFHEDRLDELALSDLVKTRKRHPSIYKKETILGEMTDKPDGTKGQFIVNLNAQLRLGAKLSFIRTVDGHSYEDYDGPSVPVRSWDMIRLAKEYGERLEEMVAAGRARHVGMAATAADEHEPEAQ